MVLMLYFFSFCFSQVCIGFKVWSRDILEVDIGFGCEFVEFLDGKLFIIIVQIGRMKLGC